MAQENIFRVWAIVMLKILHLRRVLEKAGMQREGILRRFTVHPNISDEPRDSYCYSVVKVNLCGAIFLPFGFAPFLKAGVLIGAELPTNRPSGDPQTKWKGMNKMMKSSPLMPKL